MEGVLEGHVCGRGNRGRESKYLVLHLIQDVFATKCIYLRYVFPIDII